MRVPGFSLPVEDYVLVCVANVSAAHPNWDMLRAADLERMAQTAFIVGQNLGKRYSGVSAKAVLEAVGHKIGEIRPDLVARWQMEVDSYRIGASA